MHRKSSDEEIHQAYIKLARKHHPDMGGDINKFVLVNEAHTILGVKPTQQKFIKRLGAGNNCTKCVGSGVTSKSVGLTEKQYKACTACGGSGFIIKEETTDDIIELGGVTSPEVPRGDLGRGRGTRKRSKH